MTLYMIELPVRDFAESVAWYRDVLGLVVSLLDEPKSFALLTTPTGERLALKQSDAVESGEVKVHFQVTNLDAELARLAVRGVVPHGDIRISSEGYRQATVHDPDGHALSLFEWVRG